LSTTVSHVFSSSGCKVFCVNTPGLEGRNRLWISGLFFNCDLQFALDSSVCNLTYDFSDVRIVVVQCDGFRPSQQDLFDDCNHAINSDVQHFLYDSTCDLSFEKPLASYRVHLYPRKAKINFDSPLGEIYIFVITTQSNSQITFTATCDIIFERVPSIKNCGN
jgi:hypothetical protein